MPTHPVLREAHIQHTRPRCRGLGRADRPLNRMGQGWSPQGQGQGRVSAAVVQDVIPVVLCALGPLRAWVTQLRGVAGGAGGSRPDWWREALCGASMEPAWSQQPGTSSSVSTGTPRMAGQCLATAVPRPAHLCLQGLNCLWFGVYSVAFGSCDPPAPIAVAKGEGNLTGEMRACQVAKVGGAVSKKQGVGRQSPLTSRVEPTLLRVPHSSLLQVWGPPHAASSMAPFFPPSPPVTPCFPCHDQAGPQSWGPPSALPAEAHSCGWTALGARRTRPHG